MKYHNIDIGAHGKGKMTFGLTCKRGTWMLYMSHFEITHSLSTLQTAYLISIQSAVLCKLRGAQAAEYV